MTTSIKSITNPRLHLDILKPKDVRRIHAATMEVLETVGVKFPSAKALDIWEEHGADIDRETSVVKIRSETVENALKAAPPVFSLGARNKALDLPLDGNHVFVGTDGCGVEVIDIRTGELRRSCLKDVQEIARVADGCQQVAFNWVPVSAQDCPPGTRSLHELKAIWENSAKHVQTESIYSEKEALAAVEMAKAIAGGERKLREHPILSLVVCSISPLAHDPGSLEAALAAAGAGLPVGFMTMVSCASSGPVTPAGSLVVGNAEVLSGLALIQLAYPGSPVFYAAAQTTMDLRTGAYTGGGPEDFLFGAASNILADHYNIPLSMGSYATGAKEPNWQAGIENSLSAFMAAVVMSDILQGIGLLNGSLIWSYEQLIMDCEIFDIIHKMMQGIEVNTETLGIETIRKVGPGAHFLTQEHTRKHMRELWLPTLMDRRPYSEWKEKKDGARDWALERARHILNTHQPDPIPREVSAELEKIIRSSES
ncbi:MAG: trimethylamine methyltransferase family protein [Candidatus Aminicenantes bacterium]|nr:trimethylamine methyltransferase family protein [Candidatus Aminicenantes bacterium]